MSTIQVWSIIQVWSTLQACPPTYTNIHNNATHLANPSNLPLRLPPRLGWTTDECVRFLSVSSIPTFVCSLRIPPTLTWFLSFFDSGPFSISSVPLPTTLLSNAHSLLAERLGPTCVPILWGAKTRGINV